MNEDNYNPLETYETAFDEWIAPFLEGEGRIEEAND